MSANANDLTSFGEGELSQELIDQMLNRGNAGPDPWADDTLQAEIDAARMEAGVAVESGSALSAPAPTPIAERRGAAAGAAPTAVHPVQFIPQT